MARSTSSDFDRQSHTKYLLAVTLVSAILITATGIAGYITQQAVNARLHELFDRQADYIASTYHHKLYTHITVLEGIRGLWNTDGNMTYDHFAAYIKALNVDATYLAGVSSFFYITPVSHINEISLIQKIKADPSLPTPYLSYVLHPESEADPHYPVQYVLPIEGRESSVGLDFATYPERLDAINYAKSTGLLATTKPQALVTTGKAGFFFFLPLYDPTFASDRQVDREHHFRGVVGATFRSDTAFVQIFGEADPYPFLNFQIYQGEDTTPDRLLYEHNPGLDNPRPRFITTRVVRITGQTWTITVQAKPTFALGDTEQRLPLIVFVSGILLTTLLIFSSLFRYFKHVRAQSIVK